MSVAVIVNPISGTGGRPDIARQRAELAAAAIEQHGADGEVFVTEHAGHARELTRAALERGTRLVLAWGGDGTVNEVASVLAFTDATLGIIPSGSGNGLSRELAIPFAPRAAFEVAFSSACDCVIDAGELDGRLFFNIAGIGLDARVAHRFAAGGLVRRGFFRYLEITAHELFTYEPDEHTIVVDGETQRVRALLIAIANGRQYGNGAIIAPHALFNDGRLDVVVVAQRSLVATFAQIPRVFSGQVDRVRGVTMRAGREIEITSARPVVYHVDGEPFVGSASVKAHVRPAALRVRAPSFTRNLQP
jgi:diacylglycerol kinase (ATP)